MIRRLIWAAGLSAGLILCLCLGTYLYVRDAWRAPGPHSIETTIILPKGSGLQAIANSLKAKGVIAQAPVFLLGLFIDGGGSNLKAGEYAIGAKASMADIAEMMRAGRVLQHRVIVPEGWTSREVLDYLATLDFLDGPMPNVPPPEGGLRPNTYFVERGVPRASLITRMMAAQSSLLDEMIAAHRQDGQSADRQRLLILASIIERESAVAAERPHIAGVFLRRLQLNMRLQSDPTVMYGLTNGRGRMDRDLTHDDLRSPSPWNTYVIDGLPPTPICNPGESALLAAIAPTETDDLYFVADGNGGHAFAKSLAEHNRNVAAWRKRVKATDQGAD